MKPLSLATAIEIAPAIITDHPHPFRGEGFTHVHTVKVLEQMLDAGYAIRSVQQAKGKITLRGVNTGLYNQHLIRMRPATGFNDVTIGDSIPEIIIINSHDGSGCFTISAGLFRLICLNGMIVGEAFESLKLQHRHMHPEEIVQGAQQIWAHLPKLLKWQEAATQRELSDKEVFNFAHQAQILRFPTKPTEGMPFDPTELLKERRVQDEGRDLWHTYQRIQENIIKGGIEGKSPTGRVTRMREITGVQADIELNRGLFDIADSFLKAA